MKKLYSKPEIMFENFTLSTNIAAGCEVKINNQAVNTCTIEHNDGFEVSRIFAAGIAVACTTQPTGKYNGLCYDTPSETFNLFNS